MNAYKIIKAVRDRIEKNQEYIFIHRDGRELIVCSRWYWLTNKNKKTKELDWYSGDRPFYTKYMKLKNLNKNYEMVGKL